MAKTKGRGNILWGWKSVPEQPEGQCVLTTAILGSNILAWGQGPSNRGMRGETSFILIQQTFIKSLHQVLGIQYCAKSLPSQSTPSSTGDKSTDNEGGGAGSAGRLLPGRTWAMGTTDPRGFIRAVTRSIYVCKRFLRPENHLGSYS